MSICPSIDRDSVKNTFCLLDLGDQLPLQIRVVDLAFQPQRSRVFFDLAVDALKGFLAVDPVSRSPSMLTFGPWITNIFFFRPKFRLIIIKRSLLY